MAKTESDRIEVKVERSNDQVVRVILTWRDISVPFVKKIGGEPYRQDWENKNKPEAPTRIYAKMHRQACGIFNPKAKPLAEEILPEITPPNLEELMEEANLINQMVTAKALGPGDKLGDRVWEIIKSQEHKKIRPDLLMAYEREWLDSLKDAGITFLAQGWIQIIRWKKTKKGIKKILLKVKGIFSALRMQGHILKQYEMLRPKGELAKLERYEDVIERANRLLVNWKNSDERNRKLIEQELVEVIFSLDRCINIFKVDAREELRQVIGFEDSRGRINPPAMAARTARALGLLALRFREVGIIMPAIALRKEMLIIEQRRLKAALTRSARVLADLIKGRYKLEEKNINAALAPFYTVWAAPYFWQTCQAESYLKQAKKALGRNLSGQAMALIKIAHGILKTNMSQFDRRQNG